jgi:hypothetical protein
MVKVELYPNIGMICMAYLTTQGGQPVLILKEGTSRKRGKEV